MSGSTTTSRQYACASLGRKNGKNGVYIGFWVWGQYRDNGQEDGNYYMKIGYVLGL